MPHPVVSVPGDASRPFLANGSGVAGDVRHGSPDESCAPASPDGISGTRTNDPVDMVQEASKHSRRQDTHTGLQRSLHIHTRPKHNSPEPPLEPQPPGREPEQRLREPAEGQADQC